MKEIKNQRPRKRKFEPEQNLINFLTKNHPDVHQLVPSLLRVKVNFRSLHNSLTVPGKGFNLNKDRVSNITGARSSVVSTVFCYRRFN